MKENLVQWTLLRNLNYLSEKIDFPIAFKKGQEVTTDFGRIDFILENHKQHQLIVELETILDSKGKRDYCFNQILNYQNVKFTNHPTNYCILFAEETNYKSKNKVSSFGKENNILVKTYSLDEVKVLYKLTVERLSLSFGLSMPKPANYTISYLRWLNKILKPFKDFNNKRLTKTEMARYFSSVNSTNFRCYLQLATDFEMINIVHDKFIISKNGLEYIENFNIEIENTSNLSSIDMTNEQKKYYYVLLPMVTGLLIK